MAQTIDRPPIVVGVDLGNANCRFVAWHDPAETPILVEAGNVPAYPAVVARDQELGGWLVGASALEEAYRDSVTVYSRLKENVLQGNGDGKAAIQRLLSKLKFGFQADCAARVVSAVLSVPYGYATRQRAALKEAASLAGLPVAGLINEPEAAVLGYRIDEQLEDETENILVFNAGASQCTASVVRVSKQVAYLDIELLSEAVARTEEGAPVGGDAMDECLYGRFVEGRLQVPPFSECGSVGVWKCGGVGERGSGGVERGPSPPGPLSRRTGEGEGGEGLSRVPPLPLSPPPPLSGAQGDMDPLQQARWLEHEVRDRLREARHFLSGERVHEFEVPWDGARTGKLSRDDVERWASYDAQIAAAVQAAVRGARDRDHPDGFVDTDIDRVLIVGALNRSPFVSRLVDHFLRVEPREEGFEEAAIAAGAARCAAILTGRCDDVAFRPRETPAFGIRTGIDTFDKVIPENAPARFRARKVYTLPNRFARQLVLEVCQGFSRRFLDEMSLGRQAVPLDFPEGAGPGTRLEREIHLEMEVSGAEVVVQVLDQTRGIAQPVPQTFRFRAR